MGERNLKIYQNFAGTIFFLKFVGINLYVGELKLYGGSIIYYYTCIISFLSKQPNTQKSEVFLLRISSGNVNASGVVTCQYPQTY